MPACVHCDAADATRMPSGLCVCARCQASAGSGYAFKRILIDQARASERTLDHHDRSTGRVRTPHRFPVNPHD